MRYEDVDYRGELRTRFAAALSNLLTRSDRYSTESFRASASGSPGALWWDWPGDQLGRYLSVLHVAQGYGWSTAAAQRAAIGGVILPIQTEAGNFGPKLPLDQGDARVPSGNAFALRGLTDAFRDSSDERYLEAARHLARYFEAIAPHWQVARDGQLHEFYGHCLDGLVHLYELGGDEWALALARRLGANAGRTSHTHHTLSMLRGLLELYRVTEDPAFLAPVEDYLTWCRECHLVSGGLPESMPASPQDEGCALADYLVVNLMAFSLADKKQYLEEAERLLVNHFFMNQFHTGGFGHRAFDPAVVGGKLWQGWDGQFGSENPGCCSLWGAWALGELGRFIVTDSEDAVEVNLYPQAIIRVPDRGLLLELESDFPRMSEVRLRVWCMEPERFALRLRIPAWVESVKGTCAGESLLATPRSERLVIARRWLPGDAVELSFRSPWRIVRWPAADSPMVALFDGPLCLGLSSAVADIEKYRFACLGEGGLPVACNESGDVVRGLAPIAEDWRAPDVREPNRLRILFEWLEK
ncbi:MAG: beta-L-arabinofuranosidase domain-containing protein [Planctomycetota bacterium]